MSVLVTGGAGYIGSHTVRALRATDHAVVVLDTMELGHRAALLGAELVVGNIRDRALVTDLCRSHGVTQIVHFAAYKNVGESMEHPDRYWLNNVAGSVDLVEGALAAGVKEIVFSSSCSVNGTPTTMPVTVIALEVPSDCLLKELRVVATSTCRRGSDTSAALNASKASAPSATTN